MNFYSQEYGSICSFILNKVTYPNEVTAYYEDVKSTIKIPAIHFNVPEVIISQDILGITESQEYTAYIKLYCCSNNEAMNYAHLVNNAITFEYGRYLPLLDIEGKEIQGEYVRTRVSNIQKIDTGIVQMQINWTNNRRVVREKTKDSNIRINMNVKGGNKNG